MSTNCSQGGYFDVNLLLLPDLYPFIAQCICKQVAYSLELAQHYMWAQDDQHVFLAAHVPTGQHSHTVIPACFASFLQGVAGVLL